MKITIPAHCRRALVSLAVVAIAAGCSSAAPVTSPTNAPTAPPRTAAPVTTPVTTSPAPSATPHPTSPLSPSVAPGSHSASPSAGNPIAVFDVVGETFRIELVGAANLAHARALLAGTGSGPIPSGLLKRGSDGGVNAPWSWHVDPSTLQWADMTTEVCDGRPSQIQAGIFTYPRFCPWSAKLITIEAVR